MSSRSWASVRSQVALTSSTASYCEVCSGDGTAAGRSSFGNRTRKSMVGIMARPRSLLDPCWCGPCLAGRGAGQPPHAGQPAIGIVGLAAPVLRYLGVREDQEPLGAQAGHDRLGHLLRLQDLPGRAMILGPTRPASMASISIGVRTPCGQMMLTVMPRS